MLCGFLHALDCFWDELAKVGDILLNKEWNVHTVVYDCDSESEEDLIEIEINDYAKLINILIHDTQAKLDYEIICKKLQKVYYILLRK